MGDAQRGDAGTVFAARRRALGTCCCQDRLAAVARDRVNDVARAPEVARHIVEEIARAPSADGAKIGILAAARAALIFFGHLMLELTEVFGMHPELLFGGGARRGDLFDRRRGRSDGRRNLRATLALFAMKTAERGVELLVQLFDRLAELADGLDQRSVALTQISKLVVLFPHEAVRSRLGSSVDPLGAPRVRPRHACKVDPARGASRAGRRRVLLGRRRA